MISVTLSDSNWIVPKAHAATGEVCLADPSAVNTSTPCPGTLPVFSGPIGQEIRVGVFVQGSDALNGFDISLLGNHTFLTPIGIDLTRTVVPGATTIILECVQGILKAGSVCAPTDNINTLHLVITAGLGLITTPPTTGLLFTAVYNITGTTASGGISLGYQTGCSTTSVSGGVCVTIANGSTNPDVETVQASTFDNSGAGTMPSVALSAAPTSFGPQFPGTSNTATITATAQNGYPSFSAPDLVNFTVSAPTGLTTTLSANSCMTLGTFCTVSVSLSATAAGNYTAVISGTYETADASGNLDTLVGIVNVKVVVYDFGLTISPTSLTFISGSSGVTTITLSSLNHFAGSISLSTPTNIPPSPALTVSYSSNTVTLSSGQTINVTVVFSATTAVATTWHVITRGTSGTRTKNGPTLTIADKIGDLTTTSVNCVPSSVNVNSPSSCTATVTDTNASPTTPTGTVAFTSTGTGTFTPKPSCTLSPGGTTGTATCQISYTPIAFGTGTHNINGTYGGDSTHGRSSGQFSLTVTVPGETTTTAVACAPSSVPLTQSTKCTATVTSSGTTTPTGTVSFASDSGGTFVSNSCSLSGSLSTASCFATYTPSALGTGTHMITASYPGDTVHGGSSGQFGLKVTDFTISASPTSVTATVGSPGNSTITISPLDGFANDTVLTSDNAACVLVPSTVVGGSGSSKLSCTFATTGTLTVTVTGTVGSLTHTVAVGYTVTVAPDFTLSASPLTINAQTGTLGNSTITVIPINSFSSTVNLAVATNSTNLACSVNPTSITGGSGSSKLSCSSSVAGSYQANVTGTSGTLSHKATVTYHITAPVPDFSISANPASITVNATFTGTSNITIGAINGFTGTVNLTVTTNSTNLNCSPTSSTVSVPGSVKVSCIPQVAGNYLMTATGVSGSLSHSATVVFHAQDYRITSSPTSISTGTSVTGTSTISVSSLNGYTNTVSLAVASNSTNLSCNLSSNTISGGSGTSTLTCNGTVIGHYLANVTGTSGSLFKSIGVIVYVVDFSLSSNPSSASGPGGSTISSTITIAQLTGSSGTITVSLAVSASPSGLGCSLSTTSIVLGSPQTSSLSCTGSLGNYIATVTATGGGLTRTTTVSLAVTDFSISASPTTVAALATASASSTITITPANGFTGTVTLLVTTNSTSLSCSLSSASITGGSGTSTLSCSGSAFGNYQATVIGVSSSLSHSQPVTFNISDFDFSTSNATPVVAEGASGSVTLIVTGQNGFSSTVSLHMAVNTTVPGSYPQPSISLSSPSITPVNGIGSATVNMVVGSNAYPSTYEIRVNATSGPLLFSLKIILTVPRPGFLISHSPTLVVIVPGQTGTANINVTARNTFNGSVTFSYTLKAPQASGLACSFSRTSVELRPGGSNSTVVSCSGSTNLYSVAIIGTAANTLWVNGITNETDQPFSVIDFSLSSTPSQIILNPGQTGHAQINVTWTTGYSAIIAFKAIPSSGAVNATIPASLSGSGVVTLNIVSNAAGTYTVVVNATSNTDSHTLSITVTVLSVANANILGLDPTTFYSIIGILIVIIALAVVLALRRTKAGRAPKR